MLHCEACSHGATTVQRQGGSRADIKVCDTTFKGWFISYSIPGWGRRWGRSSVDKVLTHRCPLLFSCSYYRHNEVDQFQYSRPFRKGEKDPDNEFAVSTFYIYFYSCSHQPWLVPFSWTAVCFTRLRLGRRERAIKLNSDADQKKRTVICLKTSVSVCMHMWMP